tara:strand:- start:1283 stop:2170 length:888 start_codon:yes stop_codon:yes gene_type:complete
MNTFRTKYAQGAAFYEGPDDGFIKVGVKDVDLSVQSFAREVANKLWNIEFYVSDLYEGRLHLATKLHIHTKGQPFFLGNIYREADKFGVWSRRITNNKKPNAAESVNFKTALRNAAKHLQLWDVAELAGRPAYKYTIERRRRVQAVSSEAMDALTRIGVVNEKAPVLKYLLTEINGNRYVGEELRADVDKYIQQKAAYEELQNSGQFPLFVYVSKDTNNYDCMDVMNVDVDATYSGSVRTTMARRLHDWDALFQQLLPKMSVLNVMDAGEYVNGAGMKYSDNMFLVVSDDDDGVT